MFVSNIFLIGLHLYPSTLIILLISEVSVQALTKLGRNYNFV
jgi:hypothetical protein